MLKLRRRTAQEPTVPPGADFAYEVAAARLDDQLGSVADLDRKLGVVIAIAGALLAALAQFANTRVGGESPLWVRAAGGLPAVLSLLLGFWGFFVRKFQFAPDPRRLSEYVAESAESMRWTALPAVLKTLEDNHRRLRPKRWLLNGALVAAGLAVIAESTVILFRLV